MSGQGSQQPDPQFPKWEPHGPWTPKVGILVSGSAQIIWGGGGVNASDQVGWCGMGWEGVGWRGVVPTPHPTPSPPFFSQEDGNAPGRGGGKWDTKTVFVCYFPPTPPPVARAKSILGGWLVDCQINTDLHAQTALGQGGKTRPYRRQTHFWLKRCHSLHRPRGLGAGIWPRDTGPGQPDKLDRPARRHGRALTRPEFRHNAY